MNRRFNVDVIYNMTSLTIARAEVKDSGTYNLKLSNGFGQATLSTKLIVIGKCQQKIQINCLFYWLFTIYRTIALRMAQFPEIPVTVISDF